MTPERLKELNDLEKEINDFRTRVGLIGSRQVELSHLWVQISKERLGSGIANVKLIRRRLEEMKNGK